MIHPLDNPIWNALNTGSADFSYGKQNYRFIDRKMGFFAGLPEYDEQSINLLNSFCESGQNIILFTPEHITTSENWIVHIDRELLQMVYELQSGIQLGDLPLEELGENHIDSMLELTELTKPGPFLSRTIDFGGYVGAKSDGKLISMAGRRLSPEPYVEISAVCTHPDFLGRGLSAQVISKVMEGVLAEGKTPFLHVYPDNYPAIRVYQKLGFTSRKILRVYRLEKI